jgi:hydroxylysine kinase
MKTLTSFSAPISSVEAERLAARHYGLDCVAVPLPGERDSNFRLDAATGSQYLLKIAHAAETGGTMSLETAALHHVQAHAPHLDVQRIVTTSEGESETTVRTASGELRHARLTTFLSGALVSSISLDRRTSQRIGGTLAELGHALVSFWHPAAHRELLWDISAADRTRPLLDDLRGLRDRELLEACLDQFDTVVRPQLRGLRAQIVHNDLTRSNTVLLPTGAIGVIDFGDIVHTELVNDLAVAVTDFLVDGPEPLGPALDIVRGFNRVRQVDDRELSALFSLVRTRLAMMIIITEWRRARFPGNRAYIARKTQRCWSLLRRLPVAENSMVTQRFVTACAVG